MSKFLDYLGLQRFWGKVNALKADKAPNNHSFDGVDLSTVFESAAAFHTALAAGDFSKIRVGDYWPLSLSGTFRDYGAYTVPSGTAYFTDAALTTQGGTTSAKIEGQYESATAVKFKVSGSDVYCAIGDCLDYFERTCNNAVVNLEVAGINNYWRYGDSGDLTGNNKPHITFVSRDCLPFTMRLRKANAVWENTEETNPWRGSALFKTLNDPDYGVVKLIAATDVGAYMYAGPNGGGMRAMMEVKASGATTASSCAWADRGKLFLPFESEIWGHTIWGGTGYTMACGLQPPIFAGTRRHISKGIGNGASRYHWWTASSYSGSAPGFCNVGNYGIPDYNAAVYAIGAPVCFVMI